MYKIIIFILVILSFITKNKNLGIAALIIFVISLTNSEKAISFIEKYCMDIGMIFLMLWMLAPLIKQGSNSFNIRSLLSVNGIVSLAMGIIVAILAAKGVNFTKGNADVLSGVVLGSIVGVSLLGGVPVGPLIASGVAYEIVRIINFITGNK
ncbi:hypothetical protein HMPREF1982_01905 [Clostridiales bacterium oral taxon 876 str. F0540]|nr:hypothetical protein HMPREF1982_01905 [Clostridiales bacterium oral taxon 876 str. F0540]